MIFEALAALLIGVEPVVPGHLVGGGVDGLAVVGQLRLLILRLGRGGLEPFVESQ